MATFGTPEYSAFFGSPVTIPVTATAITPEPSFHRLVVVVTINNTKSFTFSAPVTNDYRQVTFDISSAFKAFAEQHEYKADVLNSYPKLTATMQAYEDYMINGEAWNEQYQATGPVIAGLYAGALTDRERMTGERPSRYSRKPTSSPEIVFNGMTFLLPVATTSGAIVSDPAVTPYVVGRDTIPSEANVYAVKPDGDCYELRFINSLRVHESLHVRSLRKTEVDIQTDKYVISRQETLTKFSRGLAVKQNNHERWTLSSGPVDRQWASWYIHEFMMAEDVWMKADGLWVPCHVLPEETTQFLDRSRPNLIEISFAMQLDINGSPFA